MRAEEVNPYRPPALREREQESPPTPISRVRYTANVGCGSVAFGLTLILLAFLGAVSFEGDRSIYWAFPWLAAGAAGFVHSIVWASRRRPAAVRARQRNAHR